MRNAEAVPADAPPRGDSDSKRPATVMKGGHRSLLSSPWYVVILLCLLGILSYMDRLAFSLIIDPIRSELGITDREVGLLMGPAFSIVYAIAALPVAWAIDRGNRKWILAIGVALWSFSTSAAAFAPDFSMLFVLRMGVGVGEAVLSPAAVSLIGDLFVRERRPTPMAAVLAAQTIGAGASFIIVAAVLAYAAQLALLLPSGWSEMTPWRTTLLIVGLPGLVIAAAMVLTVTEPVRGATDPLVRKDDANRAGAFPSRRRAITFFFVFLFGGNCASTPLYIAAMWYPAHLMRTFELSASTVGFSYGVVALICGGIGTLGLPALAEQLALRGRKDILLLLAMGALPIALILFLLACNVQDFGQALIAAGLFLLIGNGVGAIPSVVIAGLAAAKERGRITALHIVFQALIPSALAPFAVGLLSDLVHDGNIGASLSMVASVAYPLAFIMFLLCRRAYSDATHGRG